MSLAVAIDAFITSCCAAHLSPCTVTWYRARLTAWSAFVGDQDWRDPRVTCDFLLYLQSRDTLYADHPYRLPKAGPYSVYTLRAHVRAIKRFCNWMVEEGRIADNPARHLRMPKSPKILPRGISACDFEKLLAATDSDRDVALLLVLRDTGCRASEIAGLKASDVDCDKGIAVVIGKGQQERFTFLSPPTCEALRKWMGLRPVLSPDDPVFVTSKGPFRPGTINEVLKRLARWAGVYGSGQPAFIPPWICSRLVALRRRSRVACEYSGTRRHPDDAGLCDPCDRRVAISTPAAFAASSIGRANDS